MEVRGIGIVDFDYCRSAPVALILDLTAPVERLPQACESKEIAGISIPMCAIAPFEASAPAKVALALKAFGLATGANGGATRKSESNVDPSKAVAKTKPRRRRSARTTRVMSRAFSVANNASPFRMTTAADTIGVRSGA